MYSFSIDYLFNRVYDFLLWIKYTWLFSILRTEPEKYLEDHSYRDWDGLRDRGWFDQYFKNKESIVPEADVHISLWQKILEATGIKLRDSDADGIPDVTDTRPFDKDNLSKAELKERYEEDYTFTDHIRDVFGIGPKDSDKDGVPDSYELKHNLDHKNPDSDRDGFYDGQELLKETDPLNNDTDGDLVLDGRDEAPNDINISSIGKDTDGDGVSDRIENYLGMSVDKKDTDGDLISDGMDTYPLDNENIGSVMTVDLNSASDHISFSIQNPILHFFTDILSIALFIIMLFFVYVSIRWFLVFLDNLNHYDHHFDHDNHNSNNKDFHIIKHHDEKIEAGIKGLPINNDYIKTPSIKEYENHPKFSVIQGYMSSQSEALWRIGIMEADNLLLEVLTEKGYQGEGVGEKLKNASFKTIDLAWDAHKVRNRIAHEGSDFQLTERESKRAFMLFESVFRDLKVIK